MSHMEKKTMTIDLSKIEEAIALHERKALEAQFEGNENRERYYKGAQFATLAVLEGFFEVNSTKPITNPVPSVEQLVQKLDD